MNLKDKHVVVTGGTGALGRAVVQTLLENHANVHVPNNDSRELDGFPHKAHPRVRIARGVDLTQEGQVEAFYGGIDKLWGSVHLAGGFAMSSLRATRAADVRRMMDLNLLTAFLCCRAAAETMRRTGRGGRIVNVAARAAVEPRSGAGMVPYTASKAAVAAMSEALAQELLGDSILVNAIAPSVIDTPANRQAMPRADHASWARPADIAETVRFLVSPDNKVTRGGIVPVYGLS